MGGATSREELGRLICTLSDSQRRLQSEVEDEVWRRQSAFYEDFLTISEKGKGADGDGESTASKVMWAEAKMETSSSSSTEEALKEIRRRQSETHSLRASLGYKFWNDSVSVSEFWDDFESLSTRDEPLNRLFATSLDRSAALVLGFMVHSGLRLKQSYTALLRNRPNTLRNQSFLRQLIELDWMKHCFDRPGMRKQIPYQFRDEYEQTELEEYLKQKAHYKLK